MNNCIYCNKPLRKIKNDWTKRNSHKKCYRDNGPGSGLFAKTNGGVINNTNNPKWMQEYLERKKKEKEEEYQECEICTRSIERCKCNEVNHCFYKESI